MINREWRVVLGVAIAAAAQLAACFIFFDILTLQAYLSALVHVNDFLYLLEPRLYQSFSLRGFWSMLIPNSAISEVLYLGTATTGLLLTALSWKKFKSLELRYSALLLATVLFAPHCNSYDLVILAPAFFFLIDWLLRSEPPKQAAHMKWLLYGCYPLFLLQKAAQVSHVQFGVIAISLLLWTILRLPADQHDLPSSA